MSVQDHGRSVSHVDALRQAVRVCETFDVDRRFAAGALGEYVGTSRANDVDRSVMVLAELGVRLRSTLGDEVLRRRWEYQLANRQVRGVYVTDCTRWLTSREALSLALVDSASCSYSKTAAFLGTSERRIAWLVATARRKLRQLVSDQKPLVGAGVQ